MKTLLISDFDYTLCDHNSPQQTAANLAALAEFRTRGGLVGIATGRNLATLRRELPEFRKYANLVITLDGAQTYLVKDRGLEEIFAMKIPPKEAAEIAKITGRKVPRRWRDRIFFRGEKEMKKYTDGVLSRVRVWCVDAEDCRSLHRILAARGHNADSWYDISPETNFDLGRLKWVHDDVRHCVDIRPNGLSKSVAIQAALPYFVDEVQVITAGDNSNDIEMVCDFDGYAVNPCEELAKAVTSGHIVGSLAEVIEKLPLF